MKMPGRKFWIILMVIAVLVAAVIVTWMWPGRFLPHPAWIEAWIRYLTEDLDILRWGPVAALLLVAVLELVWAVNLGRRSSAYDRHWQRLERTHDKEIAVLTQEVAQLQEQRQALQIQLELHEDLVREEKARLWAEFEDLQRVSDVTVGRLATIDAVELPPESREAWREHVLKLERIEMVNFATVRRQQDTRELLRRVEDLMLLGGACYYLGEYERALTYYHRAIELAPADAEALINHAVVNYALGRHQPALQDLDQALTLGENAWAYLYRGLIRERQGKERWALDDYGRAVRLDPDLMEGYYRRGQMYAKMGEYGMAFQDQSRALELDGTYAQAYTARGVARVVLEDPEGALSDLDRGCALAPQRPKGFYYRGLVRHHFEMYEDALEDFSRALSLFPAFALAYMGRGDTYMALGMHAAAAADYGEVIRLQPGNTDARHARGVARAAMRDHQGAIEDFGQVLEIEPSLAVVLAERGEAYEKLGEYDLAIRDLDQAISLDPDLAIAYHNRGMAYGNKGEYDRASRDLNRAAELDPSLRSEEVSLSPTGQE